MCLPPSPLCGSGKVALARSPSEVVSSARRSKHCCAAAGVTVGDVGGLCGASVVAACHAVCRRCPGSEYVNLLLQAAAVSQDYSVHAKVLC